MPRQIIAAEWALLPNGWESGVRLEIDDGGVLREVSTSRADPAGDATPAEIVVPAAANVHSHTFQRALAGRSERRTGARDSFWSWRQTMYAFLHRLTPEAVEAIAALAFVEMLEGGFASVGEFHYLHRRPDGGLYDDPAELSARIVAAAREVGIGLTHLPVLYLRGGLRDEPLADHQKRFGDTFDDYVELLQRCESLTAQGPPDERLGVAPHSLRAVPPEYLAACVELAGERPIHLHVAEQSAEVDESLQVLGERPVRWLLHHASVDQRWCLVHATHVESDEVLGIARSGARVGLCPLTEANLGDGLHPARELVDAGGTWGVGTDSNVRVSLRGELEMLEYGQRLLRGERNVLARGGSTGEALLRDSAGAASCLGRRAGRLEAGCWADLLELSGPRAFDDGSPLDHWIFARGRFEVKRVWSAGRLRVVDGRHVASEAVRRRYEQVVRDL